jgi:hypothetical protein
MPVVLSPCRKPGPQIRPQAGLADTRRDSGPCAADRHQLDTCRWIERPVSSLLNGGRGRRQEGQGDRRPAGLRQGNSSRRGATARTGGLRVLSIAESIEHKETKGTKNFIPLRRPGNASQKTLESLVHTVFRPWLDGSFVWGSAGANDRHALPALVQTRGIHSRRFRGSAMTRPGSAKAIANSCGRSLIRHPFSAGVSNPCP